MLKPEIEEFARLLVNGVRDEAIEDCDIGIDPECNSIDAKRLRKKLIDNTHYELAAELIPDCVDATLGSLLRAIDEGKLHISFSASNGNVIDLTEEGLGELSGWFSGTWISKYTQQRHNDDFKYLDHFFDKEAE